jgi:peptide deformylase
MSTIIQKDNPILRQHSKDVDISAISKNKIQKILEEMFTALNKESDGVALAAPQIGILERIFVVSPKAYEYEKKTKANKSSNNTIFINPVIIKISKDKKSLEEGCLSVRWLYGKTRRASKVTVEAYNEKGEKFIQDASGLIAQIFQHEIDHLNGILFIDTAKNVKEIPPEKINIKVQEK